MTTASFETTSYWHSCRRYGEPGIVTKLSLGASCLFEMMLVELCSIALCDLIKLSAVELRLRHVRCLKIVEILTSDLLDVHSLLVTQQHSIFQISWVFFLCVSIFCLKPGEFYLTCGTWL